MLSYQGSNKGAKGRKMAMITHGVSLLIVFIAGFGLMARLNMMGTSWPLWIYLKVAIWLILGGIIAVIARKGQWATGLFYLVILLGGVAAWVANYKPL